MSDQKRQELIANGQLHPDGSRKERCPTCLRPFAPGEGIPTTEGSATAAAEPVAATVPVPNKEA